MENSVLLSIGETHHLKLGKDRITYAGMLSDNIYSIVQRKMEGHRGYSWNLFYPKRKTDIVIDGVNILVENVTPDEIRLRIR